MGTENISEVVTEKVTETATLIDKLWDKLVDFVTATGSKLVWAIIVLIVGLKLIKWLIKRMQKSKLLQKFDDSLQSFIRSFVHITLDILLIVNVAVIVGIPMTSFVTLIASAGVAIGLALQGALGNFAGGIMILLFKPFRVGDFIETDKYSGNVKEITVFYTMLLTLDNKLITLPNGNLTNAAVTNYTAEPLRRVDFPCSVAHSSDIDLVKKVLMDIAAKNDLIKTDPAPQAVLLKYNDSALDYELRAWCDTQDYWTVRCELAEQIKKTFDENKIEIPFPQVDVHIDNQR